MIKCPSQHSMQRLTERPPAYGRPQCDICGKKDLATSCLYFYHCPDCKYDKCNTCARECAKATLTQTTVTINQNTYLTLT